MKHSIRLKITLLLTTMVVLTIFITWLVNRTFLSDYYLFYKINTLDKAYQEISSIYNSSQDKGELSEEDTVRLEKLSSMYSVDIYMFNASEGLLFPTQLNIGERERSQMILMIIEYMFKFNNPYISERKLLKDNDKYYVWSLYDTQKESRYIDLVGYISRTSSQMNEQEKNNTQNKDVSAADDYSIVLLRTNLESIEESVTIANNFLAYVGILTVILGSVAMLIISKKFAKPIRDLSEIAKKMSDLDFDVKYKVNSKDEIGELGSSINTLSDKLQSTIQELKQANNDLLTDNLRKTEIDEMRKEFLSNVSHELKTPISLIQGYAEGLKENINEDEESRDFYCEVIMDEADKMNKMVKKLLSLNELEFGNNQVKLERFDIVTLIRSVLNSTEILFKQKEVMVYFEQKEPIYVWADEYLIEQVVTNYISNALNHVSGRKIIEIMFIPRGDRIRVAVFNTGENIPEEDLDKIWIKFYKVDKARTREYGGSGIGLSIVKAIMNSHNQECGVINRPIGVEFWFELDTKA
jgi:two-component system sensor histidine kinase VanS